MRTPTSQRGAALLILLALIIPVLLYAVVAGLSRNSGEIARARDQKTYAALAQAKEALIAYAVTYKDTHDDPANNKYYVPGYLPCPDLGPASIVDEGVTAPSCGSSLVSAMGRLPWRTLGLDALKDGSRECLWYAVSGTYKHSPNGVSTSTTTSNMMNWDANGQLKVMDADGSTYLAGSASDPSANAVAVIFAPGAAHSGQDRTLASGTDKCGGNYSAAAYLDSANGINNSTLASPSSPALVTDYNSFIAGAASDSFNDKLVYITRADIWNAIKRRSDFSNYLRALTRRAAECTALYGTHNGGAINRNHLPWARNVSLSASSIPTYAVNSRYNDTDNLLSGRLSYKVNSARSDTNNDLDDYNSNNYLFSADSYCAYTPDQQVWYDNWKDQLFYAVAGSFKPSAWPAATSCGTCLTINGGGSYAAVVIFAGEKLSGQSQSRNSATDKGGAIANYLEGSNTVSNTGSSDYQAAAASTTFNDIVYAINSDLSISCSDTNGVMKSLTLGSPSPAPPGNPENYAKCE
jgi:hypothetical protein